MISLGTRILSPYHMRLHDLLAFLEKEYHIPDATVRVWYDYDKDYFKFKGEKSTGRVVVNYNTHAVINIAAMNRSPRAVALTTAHEYMHCIQFITRNLSRTEENKDELEKEAIKFAEDVLARLWTEQKVYFPSA